MSLPLASRANAFDFLRLFAALVVVLAHVNASFETNVGNGAVVVFDGVAIFFVLSGMLVWSSAEKMRDRGLGWSSFFMNRYLRIAPALYVFGVVALIVMLALGALSLSSLLNVQTVVWLGSFAFLVPNFTPSTFVGVEWRTINDALWTIPAEISFYLAIPVLMALSRRWGFLPTTLGMVAVSLSVRLVALASGGALAAIVHHTFLELGPYFAVGMLVARYGARIPLRWWIALPAGLVQTGLLFFGRRGDLGDFYGPLKPLLLAAPLAYALLYVGLKLGPLLKSLTSRIGDLSFGVYIWHYLVAAVFITFGFAGSDVATVLVAVASLAVAACSWFFVERPALSLKKHSARSVKGSGPGWTAVGRRSSIR